MTDHIGETTKKVIDLDALENLANEDLIVDLAEAKRLLAESVDLTGLCTTPERFSECGSGEVFLRMTAHNAQARAFLARNGKGEGQ